MKMKYIETIREGERVSGIYLCKQRQSAVTKNGKAYENMILQDKTGIVDAKIWDPNSQGIEDFGPWIMWRSWRRPPASRERFS